MKKIKFFLPFAAVALLASCTDKVDGPNENPNEGGNGSTYFTVSISQNASTRTTTGTDGSSDTEAGQGNETKIYTALLVFTDDEDNVVAKSDLVTIQGTDASNNESSALSKVFEVPGGKVSLGGTTPLNVYVVCNYDPYADLTGFYKAQRTITLPAGSTSGLSDTYWTGGISGGTKGFLMSNKESVVWNPASPGKELSTDPSNPTDLGTIKVQRAMSRFDFVKEQPANETEIQGDVKVVFDQVALVNVSKTFNLFKYVSTYSAGGVTWGMGAETEFNFVQDPFGPTKAGLTFPSDFNSASDTDPAAEYFYYPYGSTKPKDLVWKSLESLSQADNVEWTTVPDKNYFVGFYCTPNSIYTNEEVAKDYNVSSNKPTVNSQKHINSTGICFRAYLEYDGDDDLIPSSGTDAIFAYNGILYGTLDKIKDFALSPGADENNIYVANIVKGINPDDEELDQLDEDDLEEAGFVKYNIDTTDNKYYVYYYYWNRHNDNVDDRKMGNMEFATVRNNVYKLAVTSVSGLGLPGDKTPDDPNEEDETLSGFFKVSVTVVPWEVRVNDIEF